MQTTPWRGNNCRDPCCSSSTMGRPLGTAVYGLIAHARCHDVAFTFLFDTHDHYQSKAKLRFKKSPY